MATDPVQRVAGDSGHITDSNKVHARVTGTISVKEAPYSAAGDGATDDAAAIQAAATAVAAAGGGTLLIPEGTYFVSSAISIGANVHVVGQGMEVTTLKITANGQNVLTVTGNYARIAHLTIDGNKAGISGTSHGISNNAESVTIEHCRIQNVRNNGVEHDTGDALNIRFCQFASVNGSAVRIVSNANDCVVLSNSISACSNGIFVYDNGTSAYCNRTKILLNVIEACIGTSPAQAQDGGIAVNGGPYTLIQGNVIRGNTGRGIHAFGNCHNTSIVGNQVFDCGGQNTVSGIDVGDNADTDFVIVGNQSYRSGASGIFAAGLQRSVIVGNVCADNGQTSTVAENRNGITLNLNSTSQVKDNIVNGNHCFDAQTTATQEYGIREWQGNSTDYTNNVYIANNCRTNKTGAILLVSTSSPVVICPGTSYSNFESVRIGAGVQTQLAGDGSGILYLNGLDSASATLVLNHADGRIYFGSNLDTDLYRSTSNTLKTDDKFIAMAGLGVGNTSVASAVSGVARITQVFDSAGSLLGYVPIYSTFT